MSVSIDESQMAINSDDVHVPESDDVGSFNHSYLQLKLGALFLDMPDYMALTKLSLDTSAIQDTFPHIGSSIVPDFAIYPVREVNLTKDIL